MSPSSMRLWPGAISAEDAIGKRISLEDNPKEEDWITIVGVVGDTKPRELRSEPVAELYMPYAQQPEPGMSLMIRYRDGADRRSCCSAK